MRMARGAPFLYKGVTDVSDCKTSKEVMEKAGLDWEVGKCELSSIIPSSTGELSYHPVTSHYGTYRKDTNDTLGVVKGKYTIVQNEKAFEFFDQTIGRNEAIFQTAGCFNGGRSIFVSAKLPDTVLVGGQDPIENYLVFLTSHDGSSGVKIMLTPIRIICQNMLASAIRNAERAVSFRHTESVSANIHQVKHLFDITRKKIKDYTGFYDMIYNTKCDDTQVMEYLCKNVLNENEIQNLLQMGYNYKHLVDKNANAYESSGISTRKVNIIGQMYEYYHLGIGQHDITGTWWGAYNAVTGYYSNVDSAEGETRMQSMLYGDKFRKIDNSVKLINVA